MYSGVLRALGSKYISGSETKFGGVLRVAESDRHSSMVPWRTIPKEARAHSNGSDVKSALFSFTIAEADISTPFVLTTHNPTVP